MSPLILDHTMKRRSSNPRSFATTPAKVQDVRRLVDIEFHAFENEQVNQVLSFRDYKKPVHFERSVRAYETVLSNNSMFSHGVNAMKRRRSERRLDPSQFHSKISFTKVVDIETEEVVSFAKFELKTYTAEELLWPADVGHERDPMMNRDWFALNERLRREYIGLTEHCYIGMLATAPRHQHQGAGTMLLEEIMAEADDAGLEIYLEATDTAKPLYEKHGFKAITELRFDPAKYGVKGLGTERQTVMVRGAQGWDGARMPVRSWEYAVAHSKAQLWEV